MKKIKLFANELGSKVLLLTFINSVLATEEKQNFTELQKKILICLKVLSSLV